ncbi:MAG: KilA-N domain-containing protein [Flavobacterium sp.]
MNTKIKVDNLEIVLYSKNEAEYISLTDMARFKDTNRTNYIIQNWMRSRSTIEFIGLWEQLNNQNFKSIEFDAFKNEAGSNTFSLTPQRWIEATNAIGIISKSGRYGGTFAHKDIAFEFATWLSPTFKLYLIKEYQRLKEIETNQYNLEWNVKRVLSKVNYTIQTDAVKDYILPKSNYTKDTEWIAYAEEADILNVALFGCTAKQWREANPQLTLEGKNLRDIASINELAILSNLESANAYKIREGIGKKERFEKLYKIARYQKEILDKQDFLKLIKKTSDDIYLKD